MPLILSSILLLIFSLAGVGQNITKVSPMDSSVLETSGLLFLDQRLITHNDSGGEPALYEIDTITGGVVRKVMLSNALNTDWEDICADSTYIYVGDFGNNFGTRKNLGIYRISITDYLTSETNSIKAELINFSYADQEDFSPNPGFTNFDAEAFIAYNDSLYIFTKNWGDGRSKVYACPKEPGTYKLQNIDVIDAKGLVTGASYNAENNTILFCGYAFFFPFLMEVSNFSSNKFSDGTINRYFLPREGSTQVEGITRINAHRYFYSAEANRKGGATLYGFYEIDLSSMIQRERQLGSTILIQFLSLGKNSKLFRLLWKVLISFYI